MTTSRVRDVLIVDDDVWFGELLANRLEQKFGATVRQATDGVQAIKLIDRSVPDLIFLDFFMPGPNGLVLLHELQSHSDLAAVPVVLCSNVANEISHNLSDLSDYGVREIIDKSSVTPVLIDQLVERF